MNSFIYANLTIFPSFPARGPEQIICGANDTYNEKIGIVYWEKTPINSGEIVQSWYIDNMV